MSLSQIARRRRRLGVLALAAIGIALGLAAALIGGTHKRAGPPRAVSAGGWRRVTIYHSSQRPGYTAWVGAWVMPDGSLMTALTQATGPVDPRLRPLMPEQILERDFGMTESSSRSGTYRYRDPRFDFW